MNPIAALRENQGMDRARFALALGVSYSQLYAHEAGLVRQVQRAVLAGLARLGYDPAQVSQEYEAWRQTQREALLA